jgi:hypothetical protein
LYRGFNGNNLSTKTTDKNITITMFKAPPQCILDTATPEGQRWTVFQLRGCPEVLGNSLKIKFKIF